tara:strand:+ start:106 stop:1176 length:1071 start_codon:yes stop_codon:yes gene_type:complete
MYDFLIVGAGLYGSVFAERAKAAGKKVLVIDQRDHIGGNCYTEERSGINVHVYGPHIFHTDSKAVWSYINRFAEFNHFVNRVKVDYKGELYSLPINLFTLYQLWGVKTPEEAKKTLAAKTANISNPKNMEEWCLANLGEQIYETFFKGYTEKHWRRSPKALPASTVRRLPIRFTFDDNYYTHRYQGIPKGGYTQIFEKMLDGVEVKLNTTFEPDWRKYAKRLVYSGRPDQLLDYKYGELPYLTLMFKHKELPGDYQGNAVINYTEKHLPYTRCVEHKHFEFGKQSNTIITYEYPVDWHKSATPYYPVPGQQELFERYKKEILAQGDVVLGGRLGLHKYFDMHQVIASALKAAKDTL